jgi:hypothetical protein
MLTDEIYEEITFIGEASDGHIDELVEVLAKLPNDVCKWAIERLVFLCPPHVNGMAYSLPLNPSRAMTYADETRGEGFWNIRIVYIAPHVFEEQPDEQYRVIAREVARHLLKHDGPLSEGEAFDKRDRDIDELLKTWTVAGY